MSVDQLSSEQLQRWREIEASATPGPWECDDGAVRSSKSKHPSRSVLFGEPTYEGNHDLCGEEVDLVFVIAARTAVPALLAAHDDLTAENNRLRVLLKDACEIACMYAHDWATWPMTDDEAADRMDAIQEELQQIEEKRPIVEKIP